MIIPFHKQEFWFSCFASCVRMVLEYYGIRKSERDLRRVLKVIRGGGEWFWVESGLESISLHFYWFHSFSLDELKELIKEEIPVIVSLKLSREHLNHTVVVIDITDKFVIIHDPERRPNMQMSIDQFMEAWSNRKNIAGYIKKI